MSGLLKQAWRWFRPDLKTVPGSHGFLRLYPRGTELWIVEGKGAQTLSTSVVLRWNQLELGQTLWQKLEAKEALVGFQFVLHQRLLAAFLADGSLTIQAGAKTWSVLPSRLCQRKLKAAARWPEENLGQRLAEGYILGSSGLLQKPKNLDTAWIERTLTHYARARAVFKELFGYDLFVVGGTLLGWARDRDIISFDKDFDTGYVSRQTEPAEIQAEFARIVKTLLERGERIELVGRDRNNQPFLRRHYFFWVLDAEHHIDVFPGAMFDGRYRRPTFVLTDLPQTDLFPLRQEKLRGHEILVPQNYEKKLAAVYGPAWRVPDPFWKKLRPPAMQHYLKQIQLSAAALLDIAALSPTERSSIQSLVAPIESNSTPGKAS